MRKAYLVSALALTLAACAPSHKSGGPRLAVSIEPQRQILEQLAGPSFTVTTLLGRGADPETFDPSAAQRLAVDEADIYFATGVLPFEDRLHGSLSANTVYAVTTGDTELIYGTHGHDHGHEHADSHADSHGDNFAVDPHYWNSVSGIREISEVMRDVLCDVYPDSAQVITARWERLDASLDSLERGITARLAGANRRVFAVWHPSLSYFARDFGLEQLSLGVEGKDLSAKALAEAIDHACADSVEVFFYQPGIDSRQAEVMSEGIGSRLVPVNTLAYDWRGQLELIADEIARP